LGCAGEMGSENETVLVKRPDYLGIYALPPHLSGGSQAGDLQVGCGILGPPNPQDRASPIDPERAGQRGSSCSDSGGYLRFVA